MQPQANKHRRNDYTHQLTPRRHSVDGLTMSAPAPAGQAAASKTHSRPSLSRDESEEYKVSININLPDYNRWRVTKFARKYPYLSLGIAFLGLLVFALFMEGLVTLWHSLRHHSVVPAVILMPKVI